MTSRLRRSVCCLLLILQGAAACTSWRVESVSPQATLDRKPRDEVQVRELSGERYVLSMPTIANDTLSGFVGTQVRHVALTAIDGVAVRRTNTVVIIGIGLLVVGGIMAIATKDACLPLCTSGPIY